MDEYIKGYNVDEINQDTLLKILLKEFTDFGRNTTNKEKKHYYWIARYYVLKILHDKSNYDEYMNLLQKHLHG